MQQHIKNLLEHKKSKLFRVLFFVYTVLLFVATLIPLSLVESERTGWFGFLSFDHSDKIGHFFMFFMMTALLFFAYRFYNRLWYFTIPLFTGILIEFLQHYTASGRTFDIWDIAANTFGILIACVLLFKIKF